NTGAAPFRQVENCTTMSGGDTYWGGGGGGREMVPVVQGPSGQTARNACAAPASPSITPRIGAGDRFIVLDIATPFPCSIRVGWFCECRARIAPLPPWV